MRNKLGVINKIAITLAFTSILFVGSALIPRQGNQLTNSDPFHGLAARRDVRGIPLVFLKRSVGDGQCDTRDQASKRCDPDTGNEPHELTMLPLITDVVFWAIVAFGLITIVQRSIKS